MYLGVSANCSDDNLYFLSTTNQDKRCFMERWSWLYVDFTKFWIFKDIGQINGFRQLYFESLDESNFLSVQRIKDFY